MQMNECGGNILISGNSQLGHLASNGASKTIQESIKTETAATELITIVNFGILHARTCTNTRCQILIM